MPRQLVVLGLLLMLLVAVFACCPGQQVSPVLVPSSATRRAVKRAIQRFSSL